MDRVGYIEREAKTKAGRRKIGLTDVALEALKDLVESRFGEPE